MLVFSCPHCQKALNGKDDLAGRVVICPACKAEFTVPLPAIPVKQPESESDPLGFLNTPHNSTDPKQNKTPHIIRLGCLSSFFILLVASFFALVVLMGLLSMLSTDPDLAAVRVYLKDNLDSGEWEEIRWWPKRPVPPNFPGTTKAVDFWKGEQVCLLKYRSSGRIHYEVFVVENGEAKPAWNWYPPGYEDLRTEWAMMMWAKYFPKNVNNENNEQKDTTKVHPIEKAIIDLGRLDQLSVTPSRPANDSRSKKAQDDRRDPKHIMQHP